MIKDCPTKYKCTTEQLVKSLPNYEPINKTTMVATPSLVQRSERNFFGRTSLGVSARTYGMKAKEDEDLHEVILGNFSFHTNYIYALIDLGSTYSFICTKIKRV